LLKFQQPLNEVLLFQHPEVQEQRWARQAIDTSPALVLASARRGGAVQSQQRWRMT
jgi:hypothetical protein